MEWLSSSDYSLGHLLLVRALAGTYLIAFLVARNQFRALLGERGLLPIPAFLGTVSFRRAPSIFHLRYSDRLFSVVAWVGAAIAAVVAFGFVDRAPVAWMAAWGLLWVIYLSIVNVGQLFYAFGWESLLLEAGFLAIFLGPPSVAPPVLGLWLVRWLVFRLEFGAGLIKLRGDRCWRKLTCLYYHHETQPMPNPLSWYFHRLPKSLHMVEVAANHFSQLVVPFGLLLPQPAASLAAAVIVLTQAWLVTSGNFSWLNTLTIVLAFSAFDDSFLRTIVPFAPRPLAPAPGWYHAAVVGATVLVAVLSYWPVRNLFSGGQLMNYSFNRFHLVNAYGAFGSITRVRHEVVIEGTDAPRPGPDTKWEEYEFKAKPGDPRRRPPQVAPYHLRLDWLMWFISFSSAYAEGWFTALLGKLLKNDPATLKLLRRVPFGDRPPTWVRARLYRYRFSTRRERRETGAWWVRTLVDDYVGPLSLTAVERYIPSL
jgi:hypothetical protein